MRKELEQTSRQKMLLEVIARLANVRPTQKLSRLTKDFSDLIAKIYIFDNELAWIRWKKRMAKKGQTIFFQSLEKFFFPKMHHVL